MYKKLLNTKVKLTMATKVHGRCYTNKREVRSMKLKMFLSDYQYRQMILKEVAMKITELPIVKQVYHHYRVREFKKENKNLDGWECYVKLLQIEEDNRRFLFNVALLRLKECLKDENTTPEKFEDQKKLVLSYSLIQEERFSGFKTWIENVEVGEKFGRCYGSGKPYCI